MITVSDSRRYERLLPVERLVTLVFALVGRDRATWVRFDRLPDPADVELWYCIDCVPYEMVPPPGELWPDICRVFQQNTRFLAPDRRPWWRRFARQIEFPDHPVFGVLPVSYGDTVVEFDILYFRGRTGQHIWVTREPTADVSAHSADFLHRQLGLDEPG